MYFPCWDYKKDELEWCLKELDGLVANAKTKKQLQEDKTMNEGREMSKSKTKRDEQDFEGGKKYDSSESELRVSKKGSFPDEW
jgi:hypothetical protein